MKKKIVVLSTLVALSSAQVMAGNDDVNGNWVVQGEDNAGSIHISCNASVATTGNVSCDNNNLTINVGGGDSQYDLNKVKPNHADGSLTTDNRGFSTHKVTDSTTTETQALAKAAQLAQSKGNRNEVDIKILNEKVDSFKDTDTVRSDEEIDSIASKYDDSEGVKQNASDIVSVKQVNSNQQTEIDSAHGRIDNVQETLSEEGRIRYESDKNLSEGIKIAREESAAHDKVQDGKITDLENSKADKKSVSDLNKRVDATNNHISAVSKTVSTVNKRVDELSEFTNEVSDRVNATNKEVAKNTTEITRVEKESIDRDMVLQGQVTKAKNDILVNTDNIAGNKIAISQNAKDIVETNMKVDKNTTNMQQNANQISVNHSYTLEQVERLDGYNRVQDDRMTVAEKELYTTTARSVNNEKRIGKLEGQMFDVQQDVRELNGIVAGTLAASTFEMPRDWDGSWSVQAGIGGYKGANALAVGVVHAGEGYAIRATVTGSDADNFSEIAYGASVTLSTSLFK